MKVKNALQFLLHHHAVTVRGYDPNSADEALKHAASLEDSGEKKTEGKADEKKDEG